MYKARYKQKVRLDSEGDEFFSSLKATFTITPKNFNSNLVLREIVQKKIVDICSDPHAHLPDKYLKDETVHATIYKKSLRRRNLGMVVFAYCHEKDLGAGEMVDLAVIQDYVWKNA